MSSTRWNNRSLVFGWVLGVGIAGCSNSESGAEPASAGGAAGATGAPACPERLELRVGEFREEDQALDLLEAGDPLHLWNAPQGGFVVTVGAEVRGLLTSIVDIEARLLDPETGTLVKDDVRTIVMKPIVDDPAWMSPDIRSRSQVAHIAMCPDTERNLLDEDFLLEIEIQEHESDCRGIGVARVPVVPRCLHEDSAERAYCECQCGPLAASGCSR